MRLITAAMIRRHPLPRPPPPIAFAIQLHANAEVGACRNPVDCASLLETTLTRLRKNPYVTLGIDSDR